MKSGDPFVIRGFYQCGKFKVWNLFSSFKKDELLYEFPELNAEGKINLEFTKCAKEMYAGFAVKHKCEGPGPDDQDKYQKEYIRLRNAGEL